MVVADGATVVGSAVGTTVEVALGPRARTNNYTISSSVNRN